MPLVTSFGKHGRRMCWRIPVQIDKNGPSVILDSGMYDQCVEFQVGILNDSKHCFH